MSSPSKSNFFRHCDTPTLEPIVGQVEGTIPLWLNGTLFRNGPGIQKVGPDHYKHFFDGLAILHRFHIENGVVTYNSRPLESDSYTKNMAANRIVVSEFGTYKIGDPCDTLFNKFKSLFISGKKNDADEPPEKMTDNCVINVGYYGDELFAMTESVFIRRIDPETLKTIGKKTRLTDYLSINQATAHPHVLEDGTVLNIGNNYHHKKGTHYCIVQIPPTFGTNDSSGFKNAKVIAEIPARWRMYPCYTHSFGMTGTGKIIYIEQPYCFKLPKILLQSLTGSSYKECLEWYSNYKTRIYIASMDDGQIHPIIYETDNLFTFHHANAFEENGQIIVDVTGYDNGKFINNAMDENTIRNANNSQTGASIRRYVLPLSVPEDLNDENQNLVTIEYTKARATLNKNAKNIGTPTLDLIPEILLNEWTEFPRINYKYNGLKYKYIYYVSSSKEGADQTAFPEPNNICKIDVNVPGKQLKWHGEGILASEPIFVPNHTQENPEEDDGVILAGLLWENDQFKTTLLVLNAKDMVEIGRVNFQAAGPVTSTFHGQWAGEHEKIHFY